MKHERTDPEDLAVRLADSLNRRAAEVFPRRPIVYLAMGGVVAEKLLAIVPALSNPRARIATSAAAERLVSAVLEIGIDHPEPGAPLVANIVPVSEVGDRLAQLDADRPIPGTARWRMRARERLLGREAPEDIAEDC